MRYVESFSCTHRLFSRLLLKSFIISERKSLLTSISSALGEEFFSKVATTFRITEDGETRNKHKKIRLESN